MENIKCSPPGAAARENALPLPPAYTLAAFLFPWLLWCALIFYLSAQSSFFLQPPDFFSSDKVYHFLGYTVLGYLTARVARAYRPRWSAGRRLAGTVIFCLLYGLSDELHQWFIPGRWVSLGDVLADTLGGWAGAGVSALRNKIKNEHPTSNIQRSTSKL
ncbi:MAG: VanZ family protein [Desulfobacterota bacterium]|nr:VanZ family protein [Thermodesulfobacteriota bacterium]